MSLSNVKSALAFKTQRTRFLLEKHSPEILLGVGIVGVIGASVLACRATLKAQEILKEREDLLEQVNTVSMSTTEEQYSEKDHREDIAKVQIQTALNLGVEYAPAVILGMVSIAMLVGSNRILNRRNVAVMGAYSAMAEAFKAYRRRVIDELGPEVDKYIRFQKPLPEKLKVVKENGEDAFFEDEGRDLPGELLDEENILGLSPYARWFNEDSPAHRRDFEMNRFFLLAQQTMANDLLHARGHVFLNEVFDSLGLPRTRAGAIVGWVEGHGDGYIDFGIYDPRNPSRMDFVNGYEDNVLLDFNVDGVIYDLV